MVSPTERSFLIQRPSAYQMKVMLSEGVKSVMYSLPVDLVGEPNVLEHLIELLATFVLIAVSFCQIVERNVVIYAMFTK